MLHLKSEGGIARKALLFIAPPDLTIIAIHMLPQVFARRVADTIELSQLLTVAKLFRAKGTSA